MRRFIGLFLLVCLTASIANATWLWEGDVDNNWSTFGNWNDGTVSPPATIPHNPDESMRIPSGTVNADMTDTMGYLMLSRDGTPGNVTMTVPTGTTLRVSTGSSELVSVAYSDNVTNNLNVNGGSLIVWRGDSNGELRLNHVYTSTCVGNLNLNSGVVDTEILNRGSRDGGGQFTATGGTLIIRDEIDKFGVAANGANMGFHLGGATLEIASWSDRGNDIGWIEVGNSQDTDFHFDSTSAVVFDLDTPTNLGGVGGTDYDFCGMEGDTFLDGTLLVNILGTPSYGDYWDVWALIDDFSSYEISGMFASLPANIQASLIDTGTGNDILRLTYVPEPATIALFGLGLLAIRRNKK